jgi:hypothetical protein
VAATSSDRQTGNADQPRFSTAQVVVAVVADFAVFIVVLGLLPKDSSVSTKSCSGWDLKGLICKADAHQGVIASVALLIAIAAGGFAYLSFSGDRYGERRRREAEELAEGRRKEAKALEEQHYRALVREMLYEDVHNLRHLSEEVGWKSHDLSREYEGCKLDGWPDLQFRYAEHLLEVPYVSYLERDLPDAVGFLITPCETQRGSTRTPSRCAILALPLTSRG